MRHDQIEAEYGIRPGELCSECSVPITAEEITRETYGAVILGGAAYHNECSPPEGIDGVREDLAQIAVDHDRHTNGW